MIVDSPALAFGLLYLHWIIYFLAPVLLFPRGRPVTGALLMVGAALMPMMGQAWFTDSGAAGFGVLLLFELPVALGVLILALIMAAKSSAERARHR